MATRASRSSKALAIVALTLASCSRTTPDEAPAPPAKAPLSTKFFSNDPTPEDCKRLFAAPAGAEPLCNEHVMGNGMEIHWRSYGSKEARGALEPPYQSGAGQCKYGLVFKPPLFSVSDNADNRLEMFEASDKSYPTCSVSPKPEHKTVIVISEKHGRP